MTTIQLKTLALSLVVLVTAAGCGGGGGGGSDGRDIGSAPTNVPSNSTGAGSGAVGVGVPAGGGAIGQAAFVANVHPITTQYCVACHVGSGPGFPHIAHPDGETAFRAVIDNQKVNLLDPGRSRLVERLRVDRHFCWNDCDLDADQMQAAIQAWADLVVTTTPPDPNAPGNTIPTTIISSDGRSLLSATLAPSGRYNGNPIALWKLEEGSGEVALDTSMVGPTMNLALTGDVAWVSGGGLEFTGGRAMANATDSRKLYNELASASGTQAYTIEAWLIPANTTQEGPARIITYAGGTGEHNFMLGQVMYNYVARNRSVNPDVNANGDPTFSTADADEDLQAMLQHVVLTYDQANGRRMYVNGVSTDDEDEVPADLLLNWNPDYRFALGNEVSNNRIWLGIVKFVAIYEDLLTPAQMLQNYLAGASRRYTLRFGLDGALAPNAYVEFTVSEFDAYSYLFCSPVLNTAGVTGFSVQTVRIAVNGVAPVASQSFRMLNANITQTSTRLSEQCQVVPKDLGADQDVFHIFFDTLGSASLPMADLPGSPPPPPAAVSPSAGIGIRDFAEINDSMSELTGVPVTNAAVRATYLELIQALPSNNDVEAFVSAHQMGISRLALDYCDQLVESTGPRDAFFDTGFDWTLPATTFANTPPRDQIINPLGTKMLGTGLANQPTAAEVRPHLDTLLDQLTAGCTATSCPASTTRNVVKGVCAAVLSSAAVQIH
ncbi:MAG: LamG domain-containing protein [Myxococcota bacterium]